MIVPHGVAQLLVHNIIGRVQLLKRYSLFRTLGVDVPTDWLPPARHKKDPNREESDGERKQKIQAINESDGDSTTEATENNNRTRRRTIQATQTHKRKRRRTNNRGDGEQ